MYTIKQSTGITVPFFVHDAAGDAVTGLADGTFTKRISKNGGAFGAMTVTITEMENGWYSIPLSAAHSDTNGLLSVIFTNAGAKQVNLQWRVETRILDNLAFPTTSGRSIDVEATGEVGINLDNTVGALGTPDFDADFLDNSLLADDVIATEQIATNAIGASELATDAIGSDQIAAGAITSSEAPNLDAAVSSRAIAGDAMALTVGAVDDVWDEAIEDHDTQGNMGWAMALGVYAGSDGPGIYIDSGVANTNTVVGTDGTEINPVSTFVAARTLADALGLKIYYLEGNSDITLAATHTDWEFIGIGSVMDNIVNLGSQDVSRSLFRNLSIEGTQGGAERITARDCALQDPGAGDTMLHIFAERCGFVDRIQVDTSNDNVFDQCYSLVAGTAAPIIEATGAAGTIAVRHYSGGIEFESLSASHNLSIEGMGQIIFNVSCNVNANVSARGIFIVIDNTAGMASFTQTAVLNRDVIADANWDELIAGHLGAGSTGEALNNATAPTAAQVADAVWDELIAGHVVVGSFGEEVQAHATSIEVAAVQALLPAALVGGRMDSDVAVMQANVITAGVLDTSAGQEIADRLLARSLASGADGGRTIQQALRILRNRRADAAGVLTVFEEDDVTPDWTAATTRAAGDPIVEIDPT